MKKILLMLLVVMLLAGCTQVELYDEYNKKWNLDLPRPIQVISGPLNTLDESPDYTKTFDLFFIYKAVENFSGKDFWIELGNEDRHQLISDLSEVHNLKRSTVEARRQELEELLGINLGENCRALFKQLTFHGFTEKIIMLQSKDEAKIYLIHYTK